MENPQLRLAAVISRLIMDRKQYLKNGKPISNFVMEIHFKTIPFVSAKRIFVMSLINGLHKKVNILYDATNGFKNLENKLLDHGNFVWTGTEKDFIEIIEQLESECKSTLYLQLAYNRQLSDKTEPLQLRNGSITAKTQVIKNTNEDARKSEMKKAAEFMALYLGGNPNTSSLTPFAIQEMMIAFAQSLSEQPESKETLYSDSELNQIALDHLNTLYGNSSLWTEYYSDIIKAFVSFAKKLNTAKKLE